MLKKLKIGVDLDGTTFFFLFFLMKDAKKVLNSWVEQGHTVRVVTIRWKFLLFLAEKTLLFYRKYFGLARVEVVGVGPNGEKYQHLVGFDIFFDNDPKHLLEIDGRVEHLFIFGKKPVKDFENVASWHDMRLKVDGISLGKIQ